MCMYVFHSHEKQEGNAAGLPNDEEKYNKVRTSPFVFPELFPNEAVTKKVICCTSYSHDIHTNTLNKKLKTIEYMMSTEKNPRRPITEKPLKVFDHQIHQKLATDVIGVSFDAQ